MRLRLLKFAILFLLGGGAVSQGLLQPPAQASSSGPPASHTGAPGEQTCAISGCHGFTVNDGAGSLTLSGLPEIGYVLNEPYDVTVTLAQSGRTRFGFQLTALDSQGRAAGTWDNLEPSRIFIATGRVGSNQRQYPGHTQFGTIPNGTNQNSWVLRWKAPATDVGRITFYAVGNAANGNGATGGDSIYTTNRSLPLYVVAPQAVATVSAASFAPGALSSETIAALFAAGGLADSTVAASSVPLPTTLGNVFVRIKDAAGSERNAPLFFVAATQINFLVPAGLANGAATLTVFKNNVAVGTGTLNVESVAPGLFTANANGQGVPAAVALRVKTDGSQSLEPVAQFNAASNRFEPLPLDLGPEGEQLFLIVFGTGFRNRTSLANVTSTVGGLAAEVSFAGAQGDLAGLDQANLKIPRSLAGRSGSLEVVLRVENKAANVVQIALK